MSNVERKLRRRSIGRKEVLSLVGSKFNRLTVVGITYRPELGEPKRTWFICRCDCGQELVTIASDVIRSHARSCGCLAVERTKERHTTHGMHRTPEYQCWADMWVRCTNPKNKRFKDYGGRGITVCAEWKSFEQFYIDKGRRPGKGFSLDRINNDGPYTPDNTRWATPQEQQNNNRGNRLIDINGVSKNVTQWSLECGLSRMTIYGRLKNGWDPVAAILTPSRCKRNNPQ